MNPLLDALGVTKALQIGTSFYEFIPTKHIKRLVLGNKSTRAALAQWIQPGQGLYTSFIFFL